MSRIDDEKAAAEKAAREAVEATGKKVREIIFVGEAINGPTPQRRRIARVRLTVEGEAAEHEYECDVTVVPGSAVRSFR